MITSFLYYFWPCNYAPWVSPMERCLSFMRSSIFASLRNPPSLNVLRSFFSIVSSSSRWRFKFILVPRAPLSRLMMLYYLRFLSQETEFDNELSFSRQWTPFYTDSLFFSASCQRRLGLVFFFFEDIVPIVFSLKETALRKRERARVVYRPQSV